MKKKFISKKHRRLKPRYQKIILYLFLFLALIFSLNYIVHLNTINVISILKYSNNMEVHDIKKNIISVASNIIKIDLNNPKTILQSSILYKENSFIKPNMTLVHEDIVNTEPDIFIYNTHPTEGYAKTSNNIKDASNYLKEKLESNGINVLLSTDDVTEILKNNAWSYDDSYVASRIELERIKEEYPNIKIFIDLHRDGLKKEYSTAIVDEKSCAKILFLVGKEHGDYLNNLEFTTVINDKIASKYPDITRGVNQMEGVGVNGIYNQDVAFNVILLELGGNENTYDEVINTIDLIVPILKEVIYEKK